MPSPAPVVEEDHRDMFGDEAEDDESDSEMDMDGDSEEFDDEATRPQTMPVRGVEEEEEEEEEDLNSSTDDDDDNGNPNSSANNGRSNDSTLPDLPKQEPMASVPAFAITHYGGGTTAIPQQPSSLVTVTPVLLGLETPPEAKRPKLDDGLITVSEERKSFASAASLEDSRRLFQRLWTDEDEIAILQGFYEFTAQRGTTHHAHQHDTGPFYDQIKTKLQLDFNKNQLVEKLRRLKKKYRNVISRMGSGKDFSFKSPHDQATFEISRKIWSNCVGKGSNYDQEDDDANDGYHHEPIQKIRKRGRKRPVTVASSAGAVSAAGLEAVAVEVKAVPTITTTTCTAVTPAASKPVTPVRSDVVEETVKNCLSPLFKEILNCSIAGSMVGGLGGVPPSPLSIMPLSFLGNLGSVIGSVPSEGNVADKWRKQQILELEVFSKRLDLIQEQIKVTLEELRSSGS